MTSRWIVTGALAVLALGFPGTPAAAQVAGQGYGSDYGRDRDRGRGGYDRRSIECFSRGSYTRSEVGGRIEDLRVSAPRCELGRDWGVEPYAVWVDNGCRARFSVSTYGRGRGRPGGPGYGRGPGYGGDRGRNDVAYIKCESERNRYRRCAIRGGFSDIRLVDRLSDAYCRRGQDWGIERDGIWVRNGCRAIFSYRVDGYRRR